MTRCHALCHGPMHAAFKYKNSIDIEIDRDDSTRVAVNENKSLHTHTINSKHDHSSQGAFRGSNQPKFRAQARRSMKFVRARRPTQAKLHEFLDRLLVTRARMGQFVAVLSQRGMAVMGYEVIEGWE